MIADGEQALDVVGLEGAVAARPIVGQLPAEQPRPANVWSRR